MHSARGGGAARAALPPLDADGCAADFVPPASLSDGLAELARRCAPGMHPLEPQAPAAALRGGETREVAFTIRDTSRCLRAIAVFGPELGELELELLDAAGRSYGRDARPSQFAVVGPHGPVCVQEPGVYRVAARARAGQAAAAVRLYQVD